MTDIAAASRRVIEAAAELGVTVDIHRFPEGTRTAADAASAIGCALGAIAKQEASGIALQFDRSLGLRLGHWLGRFLGGALHGRRPIKSRQHAGSP